MVFKFFVPSCIAKIGRVIEESLRERKKGKTEKENEMVQCKKIKTRPRGTHHTQLEKERGKKNWREW